MYEFNWEVGGLGWLGGLIFIFDFIDLQFYSHVVCR